MATMVMQMHLSVAFICALPLWFDCLCHSSLGSGCQPCSVMGFISTFSCSEGELKKLVSGQF